MLLFGTNLLFFCLIIVPTQGEVDLEIIKNEDGIKSTALSFIEARTGTNFSLECLVIDLKSGKKLDDLIRWEKKIKKLKFPELEDKEMLETTKLGAVMTFIPVSIENQGQYLCFSPKYKLRKVITLRVRSELFSSNSVRYLHRRRKRSNDVRDSLSPLHKNPKMGSDLDVFIANDANLESEQSDVKKVKLHGENKTQIDSIRYHDGTSQDFRIGLGVSFSLLAMLGIYRIFKCWRTGTLGPINNRFRTSTITQHPQNNTQDTCDSNQTTITTCMMQDERTPIVIGVNGVNQNIGNIETSSRQHWVVPGEKFEGGNKIRELHEEVVNMPMQGPSNDVRTGLEAQLLADKCDGPPTYEESRGWR